MKLFRKVVIVGTGLIGGSLALAIKRKGLAQKVVGISRHRKNLLLAKKKGAIDSLSQEISVVKDADLVVLATPVHAIIDLAAKISRHISKDCLVSDVGSTKKEIVKRLENIFPHYVGAHPLAGSEKRSILHACPDMFKGSLCLLTPTAKTNRRELAKIKKLWNSVGAKVILVNPSLHDRILGFVSHLPHALAFSLIDTVPKNYLRFASSGLKDTTRIAGSDSVLWADIFLSNPENISNSIAQFQKKIAALKSSIDRKDRRKLISILNRSKVKRNGLL